MMRRGFTVVELVITITVMAILLTLAVVGLESTQVNARDSERLADVEAIALNLENYYRNEDPNIFLSAWGYMGSNFVANTTELKQKLPDLDLKNVYAPGKAEPDPISLVPAAESGTVITNESTVSPQPSKTNDVYVYQPIDRFGYLCDDNFTSGECVRFNIYYWRESDNTVQKITSKRQ